MYRTRIRLRFQLLVERLAAAAPGCGFQTKLACESTVAKPKSPHCRRSAGARVARILARFSASQAWSSMAAVAPAIDSASQLYESFTLTNCSIICGWATRKPNRSPASAYDLLSDRETMIFSLCATSDRQFVVGEIDVRLVDQQRAGQPLGQFQHCARAERIVPEGLLGFGRNASFRSSRGAANLSDSDQSALEVNLLGLGALQLGQRLVEDVARDTAAAATRPGRRAPG